MGDAEGWISIVEVDHLAALLKHSTCLMWVCLKM